MTVIFLVPCLIMLYSLILSVPWSPKVNWCTSNTGAKDPWISTWELAQLDWHGIKNTTVIGLRAQALLEVTFLLNLIYSNTILASLSEWSILGKTRLSLLQMDNSNGLRILQEGEPTPKIGAKLLFGHFSPKMKEIGPRGESAPGAPWICQLSHIYGNLLGKDSSLFSFIPHKSERVDWNWKKWISQSLIEQKCTLIQAAGDHYPVLCVLKKRNE